MEDDPEEPGEFTGDSDDGFLGRFSSEGETHEASVQPIMGAIGESDHTGGLSLAPASEREADRGSMAVMPGGLDEEASRVGVAGSGDGAAVLRVAARVFAGDEAEEGHEGAGSREAAEVVELGDEAHRGDGVDAAEAAEPSNRLAVGFLGTAGGELFVEMTEPFFELIEGDEIAVEGGLARGIVKVERVEPGEVACAPRALGSGEEAVAAEKELAHAMPRAGEIFPHVFTAAAEIAKSFFTLGGRVDLGEEIGAEELGELAGVAPIGLDALSRLHRSERGSDDPAGDSRRLQLALERVAGGASLVAGEKIPSRLPHQTPRETTDRCRLVRLLPLHRLAMARGEQGDLDRLLVNIHPDVRGNLIVHDRLLSYAAPAPRALTRDRRWRYPRHPVEGSSKTPPPYDREPVVPYCLDGRGTRVGKTSRTVR